jgi:hypothetical protein
LAAIWYLARAVGRATTQETVLTFGVIHETPGRSVVRAAAGDDHGDPLAGVTRAPCYTSAGTCVPAGDPPDRSSERVPMIEREV